jgi:hypothetical protein
MRKAIPLLLAALLLAGPAAAGAASWRALPVAPTLGGAVGANVLSVAAQGRQGGNRAGVFIKVGDSISESGSFLQDMACGQPTWGAWSRLRGTWKFFGNETFPPSYTSVWCGVADSYSRASVTAVSSWTAADALRPASNGPPECDGLSAVGCELRLLRPSTALIMFGTNDLERISPSKFRRNLGMVAGTIAAAGTIPVLSTIPPRGDSAAHARRVGVFNQTIAALARRRALPLWNYWRQMTGAGVPNQGLDPDGIHPSLRCPPCDSTDFTAAGLTQGYALRNLGALRVLDRIRAAALSP